MTQLIQNLDRFSAQFGAKMFHFDQFMNYRHIPPEVQVGFS